MSCGSAMLASVDVSLGKIMENNWRNSRQERKRKLQGSGDTVNKVTPVHDLHGI